MNICVANAAFSKNNILVEQLSNEFPGAKFNFAGLRLNGDDLVDFLFDADAAIVGLEEINAQILESLPNLKFISKFGVGLDNIDIQACKDRNVSIGWTGGVNKRSVAEMTIGFMIMLNRNLYLTSNQLKQNLWNKNGGYMISNKTIGIIGFGNIGQEVFELLRPFNCHILVNDILNFTSFREEPNIYFVSKEEIFQNADIITIHTPLTSKTKNLFNKNVFIQMKSNSILINTSRGGIVNQSDLAEALINNEISGAALDVYDVEPCEDNQLLQIPNLINTPHIGGNAFEAVVAMGESAIFHLINFRNNFTK
jgi:phosphoglycerate dehydrogenase-like enzyme